MKDYIKYGAILVAGAFLAAGLWKYPYKLVQDLFLWCFFLYALSRPKESWRLWKTPLGFSMLVVLAYVLVQIPFGIDPKYSFRLLIKEADVVAALIALPVVFSSRKSLSTVWLCATSAIAPLLVTELVMLAHQFGAQVISRARWHEPAFMTHHNIGAMAGVFCLFVLLYVALKERHKPKVWSFCLVWIILLLAYETVVSSRGAQLALMMSSVIFALCIIRSRRFRWATVLILVAVALSLPVINPRFREAGHGGWLVDRDKVWKHTWVLIKDRPWVGYGYGERVFTKAYHSSHPPRSTHPFHHPHQYWLNVLFIHGWIGFGLQVWMWGLGAYVLTRRICPESTIDQRLFPSTVLVIMVSIHVFGLIDTPTHLVSMILLGMLPFAVFASAKEKDVT